MDLKALQADPRAFRAALPLETDSGVRRFGDCVDPWQEQDFQALDPAWRRVARQNVQPRFLRAYLERPRSHSKTSDLALMVVWALFASPRKIIGAVAAADRDQAALLLNAVLVVIMAFPFLGKFLEVQRDKVINKMTGSELVVLSSDAASSYGMLLDFIVVDELTHWGRRDLWDSLFSTAAKKTNCLLLTISNAGFKSHWSWQVREQCRTDIDWYFHTLPGVCASWLSPKLMAEQRRMLPEFAYNRLWNNQWIDGAGDAFQARSIDERCVLTGPSGPRQGMTFVAGLDLGISRDASALVVLGKNTGYYERRPRPQRRLTGTYSTLADLGLIDAPVSSEWDTTFHPGDGRLTVAEVCIWRPTPGNKVELEDVEKKVLELRDKFKLSGLAADNWQAQYLLERLAKQGLPVEPVHFGGGVLQEMATETLDVFRDNRIDLYPHPELLADLKALRVTQKSYGFRLTSPTSTAGEGTRHGDSATALSLGLHIARRIRTSIGGMTAGRKLVLN